MRDTNLTDGGRIVFSFISEKDNKLSKNQKIGDAIEAKEKLKREKTCVILND